MGASKIVGPFVTRDPLAFSPSLSFSTEGLITSQHVSLLHDMGTLEVLRTLRLNARKGVGKQGVITGEPIQVPGREAVSSFLVTLPSGV